LNATAVNTEEHTAAQADVDALTATLKTLRDKQAVEDEAFAQLNKEDAEIMVTNINNQIQSRADRMKTLQTELTFA
jgi:hypothetical protein